MDLDISVTLFDNYIFLYYFLIFKSKTKNLSSHNLSVQKFSRLVKLVQVILGENLPMSVDSSILPNQYYYLYSLKEQVILDYINVLFGL